MKSFLLGLAFIFCFVFAQAGVRPGSQKCGQDVLNNLKDRVINGELHPNVYFQQTQGCPNNIDENDDSFFDAAAKHFNVHPTNANDRANKKRTFYKNLRTAQGLNSKNSHATFGITHFTFIDPEEAKQDYFMKPMTPEDIPAGNLQRFGNSRRKRATTSVDLRNQNAVNPIKDQGNCGSCWSFATVATMEIAHFQKTGSLLVLAEQQLLNCDKYDNACNGGWVGNAYTYAENTGIAQNSTDPYVAEQENCTAPVGTAVGVQNYTQFMPNDTTSMMNALDQGYAVAISLNSSTSEFMYYTGGILTNADDCSGDGIDHAITVIGYDTANDTDYWIIRNSWGTWWGEEGYVRIKRGINYCNMEVYPFIVNTL
ncbi:hypothetical protein FO519_007992 [Halicephalobus sp. NKZ332]|nr:hypothetical protein FO519_007992 [Halicephalobus sp. NKZ332]